MHGRNKKKRKAKIALLEALQEPSATTVHEGDVPMGDADGDSGVAGVCAVDCYWDTSSVTSSDSNGRTGAVLVVVPREEVALKPQGVVSGVMTYMHECFFWNSLMLAL